LAYVITCKVTFNQSHIFNRICICFWVSLIVGSCRMFTGSIVQTNHTPQLFYSLSILVCFYRFLAKWNAEFTFWIRNIKPAFSQLKVCVCRYAISGNTKRLEIDCMKRCMKSDTNQNNHFRKLVLCCSSFLLCIILCRLD